MNVITIFSPSMHHHRVGPRET